MGLHDSAMSTLAAKRFGDPRGLDHFLAQTAAQREAIYRLRYEAYYDFGHISGNDQGSLSDEYDYAPGASIFGVTYNGELVSTIRLGLLSSAKKSSITYEVFKDYLDPILESGETIAHGSRLATRGADGAARRNAVLYTLSLAASFSASMQADRGAIIVRESHVPFYRRHGFELVDGPRCYHETRTPLSLMMIGLRAQRMMSAAFLGNTPAPAHPGLGASAGFGG